ncbi:DUF2073 domain-containing protein [Candidatus Woesearchaeota archaeon]|nr:DUF2073 domain-containing protein [Candidatus Woesearchaeota archaeon]
MITLQFVPYHEISGLSSERRVNKLLDMVKKNKIVVMQGRLKPNEETSLIQKTMELVSKEFKGIELCTVFPESSDNKLFHQLRLLLLKFLVGGGSEGMTIIGPATIVKEIKRNPDKVELLTHKLGNGRK